MPGRKKGRQRGTAGSKAQCARRWNDAMADAREDLAWDRRAKAVRGGDSAPPRLSVQGFRSLATLLHERVRADEVATTSPPTVRAVGLADQSAGAMEINYFSTNESVDKQPRRTRTLMSLCICQIARDFLSYHAEDDNVAQAFRLLPAPCLSRLSRAASARGTVSDRNLSLLCCPGVSSLWLRGRFTDQGASALLPRLRTAYAPENWKEDVDLARVYQESGKGPSHPDDGTTVAGARDSELASTHNTTGGIVTEAVVDDAAGAVEEWEMADDRMEACLRGGVSLTSLDVSSPRITASFVEMLVLGIPTLRRLGLRGSLGVVGGADAVCDHVPRLSALRELDLSYCTWFCDTCVRRFAKALSHGYPFTQHPNAVLLGRGRRQSQGVLAAADQFDDDDSGWGAASAPTRTSEPRNNLPSDPSVAGLLGSDVIRTDGGRDAGAGGAGPAGTGRGGGWNGASAVEGPPTCFRTFTLTCARTAVTEKGARAAESISPGLMVVLEKPRAGRVMDVASIVRR